MAMSDQRIYYEQERVGISREKWDALVMRKAESDGQASKNFLASAFSLVE